MQSLTPAVFGVSSKLPPISAAAQDIVLLWVAKKWTQHPQRAVCPPAAGKQGEQRGAQTPLDSYVQGEVRNSFGMCPVLRASPSKAHSGCAGRAEGFPRRCAPCPGGDTARAACPAPWNLHTHPGDSPGTDGAPR